MKRFGNKDTIYFWKIFGVLIAALLVVVLVLCYFYFKNDSRDLADSRESREQEPQVIRVLSTDYLEQYMMPLIEAYNRENTGYQIVYEEIPFVAGDYENAVTRINLKLLSSDAPDVLLVNYNYFTNYVENGVLEDLTGYMADSDKVNAGDYLENVLNAFRVDDKVYGLPKSFSMMTLLVRSRPDSSIRQPWTVDEFVDYWIEEAPVYTEFQDGKNMILDTCLQFGLGAYVDFEKGISYLDGAEFRGLMEKINGIEEVRCTDTWENIKVSNAGIIAESYLNNPFSVLDTRLGYNGEMINVGYPSVDGKLTCRLIPDNGIGIVSSSRCKEGAWDFIEAYLEYEFPNEEFSLSAKKEKFTEQTEEVTGEKTVPDGEGEMTKIPRMVYEGEPIYCLQKEDIDTLMRAVEGARPTDPIEDVIRGFITEEAQSYFLGADTLDQCIKKIQGRVEIYLAERY